MSQHSQKKKKNYGQNWPVPKVAGVIKGLWCREEIEARPGLALQRIPCTTGPERRRVSGFQSQVFLA